jgi:predicted Zn-dependent protease
MHENLHDALRAIKRTPSLHDLQWSGLREVRETETSRYVRDGKPEANSTSVSSGVMVEVLVDGQFGYAATPRNDAESLVAAAEKAANQARRAAQWAVCKFTTDQRPAVTSRFRSLVEKPVDRVSARETNEVLVEISRRIKETSPKIIRALAYVSVVESEVDFVSTNGSDATQFLSLMSSHFEATAQDGSVVQRRTGGKNLQGGWEHFYTQDLWDQVQKVAEQSVELLSAEECPDGPRSLLLTPDQMTLQIHESIGHPLELDRILGDERNYAGWSFVKLEDFGKLQYGSPIMNVTFDPTVGTEFASYAFDDTGTPAAREYLIKDGVLRRALGGLESQLRAGVPGVANMRASSWNRAPIDRMANINLEPGKSSFSEMIASVEKGVMMETNRSWSIDDFRNKFQFGCEYAKLIENGKLGRTVRNPNYRGVTVPFWTQLKMVGSDATRGINGTPNCGKGEPNQSIRVGHASPACLFGSVEVFGGAQ